jgi:hypothetical protein
MDECRILQEIKAKIDAGMDPDKAIPYHVTCTTIQQYIDVLYYAIQVLPDGRRKETLKRKLKEVLDNVRGTDS